MGNVTLNPPTRRRCVLCGREDVWDDEVNDWTIKVCEGEKRAGGRYCLHEWDITGSHKPIME